MSIKVKATLPEASRKKLGQLVVRFGSLNRARRVLGVSEITWHEAVTGGRLTPKTIAKIEAAIQKAEA